MRFQKENRSFLYYIGALFLLFVLVFIDQYTKYLAIHHLKGNSSIPLLPGVLELKYLENTGIAFGLFQGNTNIFLFFYIFIFAATLYYFVRLPKNKYYLPILSVLLILAGGGLGNSADRLLRGYVVDFIYFSIIDFPIFNVADIFIVTGCIFLVLLICFKYKEEDFIFHDKRKKG